MRCRDREADKDKIPTTQYIDSRGDGEGDLLVWLASLVRPVFG